MKLFQRIKTLVVHNPLPSVFFLLLVVCLFLGDGKQTLVDEVGAAGVLVVYVTASCFLKKIRELPVNTVWVWSAVLLYLFVRTVFSDDVGYSIYATVRYIDAFLLYYTFCCYSDQKVLRVFVDTVTVFTVIALFGAVVVTFFPDVFALLPSMNLLYPTFGHNQIASVIVFVFPLIIGHFMNDRKRINLFLLCFLVGSLVFSFARGAYLVTIGYLLYVYIKHRINLGKISKIVLFSTTGCLIMALLILLIPRLVNTGLVRNDVLQRQLIKNSITDNRIDYWRQAAAAFIARPFFGAGAGTFYLSSTRYQDLPDTFSSYAHSFPLQALAETGLVGFIGVLLIFIFSSHVYLSRIRSAPLHDDDVRLLFNGVVLTMLYSVYEINLDFFVVWALLWASIGIIAGSPRNAYKKAERPRMSALIQVACVGIVVVFYIFSVGSVGARIFVKNQALLEPYNSQLALAYLNSRIPPPSQRERDIILWFHKQNPDVLDEVGQITKTTDPVHSSVLFKRAAALDPENIEYEKQYIQMLFQTKQFVVYPKVLDDYMKRTFPQLKNSHIRFNDPALARGYESVPPEILLSSNNPSLRLSIFLYFLGLRVNHQNPRLTEQLWIIARDSSPYWSYFHIELASLARYELHDTQKAQEYLDYCLKYKSASAYCSSMTAETVGTVGSLEDAIRVSISL